MSTQGTSVENSGNGAILFVLNDPALLNCNICLKPLSSPVFQCKNGHIACSPCCMKSNNTCFCLCPIGTDRCLIIEKLIQSVKLPCQYSRHGCKELLVYNQKSEHEETCIYSPCHCPISDCDFLAPSKELSKHFKDEHSSSRVNFPFGVPFSVCLDTSSPFVALQSSNGVVFLLNNFKKPDSIHSITITTLSTNNYNVRYAYILMLLTEDGMLMFSSWVKFVNRRQETLGAGEGSLIVPRETVDSSGVLHLDVVIYSDQHE